MNIENVGFSQSKFPFIYPCIDTVSCAMSVIRSSPFFSEGLLADFSDYCQPQKLKDEKHTN